MKNKNNWSKSKFRNLKIGKVKYFKVKKIVKLKKSY